MTGSMHDLTFSERILMSQALIDQGLAESNPVLLEAGFRNFNRAVAEAVVTIKAQEPRV